MLFRSLGGKVVAPRKEIPEGAFAVVTDPTGAAIGLFEKKG